MANAVWQATITDQSGNVLPGAEVAVVNEATGLSAPLFTTRTGTAKSNPFFADANGFAQFYAAPGLYRITATSAGTGTTMTWRNVRLVDVATNAEAIAGAAGVLPDAAGVHSAIRGLSVGTVSQSGGVPTGAIIERGSNGNGEYVRFADGTQIVTLSITDSIVMVPYGSNGLFVGSTSIAWPAPFTSVPSVSGSGLDDIVLGFVSSANVTSVSCSIVYFSSITTFTVAEIKVIAIGRWY